MKLKFPACTEQAGKVIMSSLTIIDLTGGVPMPNAQVKGILKLAASVSQDNYPEILGKMYIVNANWFFKGIWSIVKGFLDEKTTKKIEILGGSYQAALLKEVDAENLPKFLGGTCTCSDTTGNCMTADPGPWSEYCLTKPDNRFIKKGTQLEEEMKVEEPTAEEAKEQR